MAVTIRPDSSLGCSGVLSTASENTSGKMLANPRPTRKKLATARGRTGANSPSRPMMEAPQVAMKNLRGAIQFRMTRVLGSLLEKEIATPDYYPLSLNALVNACNQKSNREPVVSYDEDIVETALEGLRAKGLAVRTIGGDSRVPKHGQRFTEKFNLGRREAAVLCVLMLRGPQTVNIRCSIGARRLREGRLGVFEGLLHRVGPAPVCPVVAVDVGADGVLLVPDQLQDLLHRRVPLAERHAGAVLLAVLDVNDGDGLGMLLHEPQDVPAAARGVADVETDPELLG